MPRREGSPRTSINHIVVTGYEKRKQPSKHYVFVIDIIWDNDERYEVLRRYSEFFTINETLQLVFPSTKNSEPNSVIPVLPKRKFFGRSHVEKVAEARVESINQYCQGLIRLNPKISQSKQVLGFFSPKIGDRILPKLRLHRPASIYPQIRPAGNTVWEEHCVIASFVGEGPNQLSAESGDQVRVVNKDDSGWWFVERRGKVGWMPESYLKKCSGTLKNEDFGEFLGLIDIDADVKAEANNGNSDDGGSSRESSPGIELEAQDYKALDSYKATEPGQLSFEQDDIITVLDKMEDGWWFVAKGKEEGWVPCGYLEPINQDHAQEEEGEVSETTISNLDNVQKYRTVAPYTAEEEDEISFPAGSVATVIYKSLTGWWMIKCEGKTGLAPATYLKKIEEDQASVTNGGSKVEVGSPLMEQKLFKQSPRQHTVRKKRSQRGISKPANHETIVEEDDEETKLPKNKGLPRNSSDSQIKKKPEVAPRKFSNPNVGNPSSSPKVSVKPMASLGVNTPPRPRQTLINRAYATPKEENEFEERKARRRNLSPSRIDERSPSPVRKRPSPSPVRRLSPMNSPMNGRAFKGSNDQLNNGSDKESANGDDHNPYTQQVAESLIKYVLASSDPHLKSALIKVVSSDPEILKALKEK